MPEKDPAARDAGHAALDELRTRAGSGALDVVPRGADITVRDREHARQLLAAWEQIPEDGSDYEWSIILHDCARHLLEHGDR